MGKGRVRIQLNPYRKRDEEEARKQSILKLSSKETKTYSESSFSSEEDLASILDEYNMMKTDESPDISSLLEKSFRKDGRRYPPGPDGITPSATMSGRQSSKASKRE